MKDVNNTQRAHDTIIVYYNWPLVLSIIVTLLGWLLAYSCLNNPFFVKNFTTTIPDIIISTLGLLFLCFFGIVECWVYSQKVFVIDSEIFVKHFGLTTFRFNVESISKVEDFSDRIGIGIRLFITANKKIKVHSTARNLDMFRIYLDRKWKKMS